MLLWGMCEGIREERGDKILTRVKRGAMMARLSV
jgi:hypothetical protein